MKAQSVADSSYFVKHASYLPDITPGNTSGIFKRISDSMITLIPLPQRDYGYCSASSAFVDVHKPQDTVVDCTRFHWDKQLRLVEVKNGSKFTDPTFTYKAFYSIGMKPLFFILNDAEKQNVIDTVAYHYGNNGMVTSVRYHYISDKEDTSWTETRLYDNQNRLIVIQNALYGNIMGVFTYAYNSNNQVVSRRFMLSSGSGILATDTLIYSVADSVNSITSVVHELKAGTGDWIKLDEMNSRVDGKPVMYAVYFAAQEPSRFKVNKNVRLRVEYDPKNGKRISEIRENAVTGEGEEMKYYYGDGMDSVTFISYNSNDRIRVNRLNKVEYRKYLTGTTLLDTKTTITYSSYYRKKKYNLKQESIETVNYKWSN